MEQYEPSRSPVPEEWLALNESERIYLLQEYIREGGEELPEDVENMPAVIHVVVENQLYS